MTNKEHNEIPQEVKIKIQKQYGCPSFCSMEMEKQTYQLRSAAEFGYLLARLEQEEKPTPAVSESAAVKALLDINSILADYWCIGTYESMLKKVKAATSAALSASQESQPAAKPVNRVEEIWQEEYAQRDAVAENYAAHLQGAVQSPQWVKASDRLPEAGQSYFCMDYRFKVPVKRTLYYHHDKRSSQSLLRRFPDKIEWPDDSSTLPIGGGESELQDLRRWKAEATESLKRWDRVADLVPVKIGQLKADAVCLYIKSLLEECAGIVVSFDKFLFEQKWFKTGRGDWMKRNPHTISYASTTALYNGPFQAWKEAQNQNKEEKI